LKIDGSQPTAIKIPIAKVTKHMSFQHEFVKNRATHLADVHSVTYNNRGLVVDVSKGFEWQIHEFRV